MTEDPIREIPVARELARRAEALWASAEPSQTDEPDERLDPLTYERRDCEKIDLGDGVRLGPKELPRVVVSI